MALSVQNTKTKLRKSLVVHNRCDERSLRDFYEEWHGLKSEADMWEEELLDVGLLQIMGWRRFINQRLINFITFEDVVLDVGCGRQAAFERKIGHARDIIALDIASSAIKKSKEALKQRGILKVNLIVATADALPIRDNAITKLLSIALLEHIKDDKKAVKEFLRVLEPNKEMLIVVPIEENFIPFSEYWIRQKLGTYKRPKEHLRHYSPKQINYLLYGAHIKSMEYAGNFFTPYVFRFAGVLSILYKALHNRSIVSSVIVAFVKFLKKMYDLDERFTYIPRGWIALVTAKKDGN